MAAFCMKIAGAVGQVEALFETTAVYFRAYLTEEAPHFSVSVSPADLEFEQAQLDQEAKTEGFRRRKFTDPFLERAAIQRAFAIYLLGKDTLLLHGSTVAVDGAAYLFTARCGTGKSTHTRLWRQVFGQRAVMVNDDKPFLRIMPGGVMACGSPWSGKHGLDSNVEVPLRGICILTRGPENRIRRIRAEEAMPMLRKQCFDPETAGGLLDALAAQTPLWHLVCNREPEAAQVAYAAMSRLGTDEK